MQTPNRLSRAGLTLPLIAAALLGACTPTGSREYFRDWADSLRVQGKMRADRLARNVRYTNADLADHFERIAFGAEFELIDGAYSEILINGSEQLKRWKGPIRYEISGAVLDSDVNEIGNLARVLGRETGLDIGKAGADDEPNLQILILGAEGRRKIAKLFSDTARYGRLNEFYNVWQGDGGWPCAGEIYYGGPDDAEPFRISYAVVYIRAEVEGLSRSSCIEEEITQALGLARDDPSVRPSIFNDDEEFALLTRHDEYLLRILYDPRIRPGMTAAEAKPVVRQIIGELRPGGA